jgi:hypothetical protein
VWENMAWGSRSGEMARCLGKSQKAFEEWQRAGLNTRAVLSKPLNSKLTILYLY